MNTLTRLATVRDAVAALLNCKADLAPMVQAILALKERVARLEAENASLRKD